MTTEPEMVERVARAILAKVPYGYGMGMNDATEYARAAIEALMEPTKPMVRAGVAAMYDINGAAQFAADAYTAMLRSSLIEGDGKVPGPPDGPGIPPQPFG